MREMRLGAMKTETVENEGRHVEQEGWIRSCVLRVEVTQIKGIAVRRTRLG